MAFLGETLLALVAGCAGFEASQAGPEYPLGRLRLPPVTQPADPFRLVDLRYAFSEDGSTVSSFDTRVRIGGSAFVGGEVRGDRRGLFFDTQRLSLGLSEENGRYRVEGGFRAPWFLVRTRAERRPDSEGRSWVASTEGSVRLSSSFELLLTARKDFDDRRARAPSLERFIRTGSLPSPGFPTRELRSGSAGFLYQRDTHFDLSAVARLARVRTEGGFDLTEASYRLASTWNRSPIEIDGALAFERTTGRLPRSVARVDVGAEIEIGDHFLANTGTLQVWEPGVLRFQEENRFGLTFFGRRHRFVRASEVAERLLALQRQAVALGYNERRVYDVAGLRAFRERLGLSGKRRDLEEAIDELYRAQVRARNVPQLGFEVLFKDDAVRGVDATVYRAFLGLPWRPAWPFSRSEAFVEFLSFHFALEDERFAADRRVLSREVLVRVAFNREMALELRWENPGRQPQEIARRTSRPTRITVSFDYALGR